MTEITSGTFQYVYSSVVDVDVQVKIGTLEGLKWKRDYEKILNNEILNYSGLNRENRCADLMVVAQVFSNGRPLTGEVYTSYKPFVDYWNWNEWIRLPIKFCDLPRNAILLLTIYDCVGPCEMSPVGGTTISLFGKYGVFRHGALDLYVWANKAADWKKDMTPGKLKSKNKLQGFYKMMRKHRNEVIPKVDWMDRLSFREMEMICNEEKKSNDDMYLLVEFPEVQMNDGPVFVLYYDEDGDNVYQVNGKTNLVRVDDPDVVMDNLVEDKHHKLSRGIRSRVPDRDAKPNAVVRDVLKNVVSYPPTKQLTAEEQDLVWKYRFYLSDQKKALIKFLKCINWNQHAEVHQAVDMLDKWAPMDIDDALLLLGPGFTNPSIRQYAVKCLGRASDDTLFLYLLQLVQAIKYENFNYINNMLNEAELAISRDSMDSIIECEDKNLLSMIETIGTDLISFLIIRACRNTTLANYFYWYLTVEYEDKNVIKNSAVSGVYMKVITLFKLILKYGDEELQDRYNLIQGQQVFISNLVKLLKLVAKESGNRVRKIEKLQSLLGDKDSFDVNFLEFDPPIFLPLDPDVKIKGIVPESATLFKSKLMPSRLTFLTTEETEYVAIFKYGDDLRQDQLVLQVITLIDNLLHYENLDLKLTPYKVLATSTQHGFVQFIDSQSVAEVLSKEGSIQTYFRKNNPSKFGPYGISPEVMDTYIRSCAGYCVITYLLGVGDRHLDNLLITSKGHFFHIDFGYILGHDPKLLLPPMKLSKEMVSAMGGVNSEQYNAFQKQCFTAFLIIRRHASLILNLFSLMIDANIPDIALEPDKAVKKVEDKLRLDLEDEEAVKYFKNLLDASVADMMAALVDRLHKITQNFRD